MFNFCLKHPLKWMWMFLDDNWNRFDFLIVIISLVAILDGDLPGISVLRLLRAFRVFRLFKKLASMRKIIRAIETSIPGVANAFGILFLVMSIYAILGEDTFPLAHIRFFFKPYPFSKPWP